MADLLLTAEDQYRAAMSCMKNQKATSVYVSTYGIFSLNSQLTISLLSYMNLKVPNSYILFGRTEDKLFDERIGIIQKRFGNIKMRTLLEHHTKAWAFETARNEGGFSAFIGSRNLGDSGWNELTVRVGGSTAREVHGILRKQWMQGRDVRPAELFKLVDNGKTYGDGR